MPTYMFPAILILASTICYARASFVTFFPSSASQCSNFTLNFTGNQISFPITFLLLPVNSSSPSVVQLPATAFDSESGSGTYTTPIPFAAGTQFVAVMHDAQGLGNGGVSTVYTVGGSNNAACLPPQGDNTLAFNLSPSPPTQCEVQTITWTPLGPNGNGDNSNNLNITGYVPGGLAFKLNIAVSTSSAQWRTSVPQGQNFIFLYEQPDPATGTVRRETSAIQNVQPGTDSDCTRGGPSVTPAAVPPSTTLNSGSQALTSTPSPGPESIGDTHNNNTGPANLPKSALIGIIVGGVCFFAILIALLYLLCVRKYRKQKLSPLEDDRQTAMSNDSRAALMKISPNAPMGLSLPPVRSSGFEIDSFSPHGTTAVYAATSPAQWDRGPSPDAVRQRGGLLGRIKGRQENASSVASWGNKGPLTHSIIELRPEPKSVPVDAMSDISEYSTPDYVPSPAPPAAVVMSRGGSGPGRQRMPIEGYYPWSDSSGSGARPSSGRSRDSRNPPVAMDRSLVWTPDSRASEYSTTEPGHISPLMPPMGRTSIHSFYPAPVQPPSRTNPLVQRRLSAYEGNDDYHSDGSGRTKTGPLIFRPAPDGRYGVAL